MTVNHTWRGPILLTLAGVFLMAAVIAYLIGDLQDNARRKEAMLRDRSSRLSSGVLLIEERTRLKSEGALSRRERTELLTQFQTIVDALERIEKAVKSVQK